MQINILIDLYDFFPRCLYHWSYNHHFLCVIFLPDAAVPLSARVVGEGERMGGWMRGKVDEER